MFSCNTPFSIKYTLFTLFICTSCHQLEKPNVTVSTSEPVDCLADFQYKAIVVSPAELQAIAQKIYQNECGGKYENLVTWNRGEAFPSLGIGHFIWFPKNVQAPFVETFPALIDYLQQKKASVPNWLKTLTDAPWPSRTVFMRYNNSHQIQQLRAFLADTMPLQMAFIVDRLNHALPRIVCTAEPTHRRKVWHNFYAVAQTPGGFYPLIDYINFKGEGIAEQERYHGQGWGLLQVLTEMSSHTDPKIAFVKAATLVLERRVRNAPKEKREDRWLKGWKKRLATYIQAHVD